jgi:hypothetical protein
MADQEEQARKMMEEQAKKMGQLTAKAWADANFKKKLVSDPAATLKAEGVDLKLPAGVSLRAVENTEKVFYVVIPARPTDLSDEELEKVAGGVIGCVRPCATQPCPTQLCILH